MLIRLGDLYRIANNVAKVLNLAKPCKIQKYPRSSLSAYLVFCRPNYPKKLPLLLLRTEISTPCFGF